MHSSSNFQKILFKTDIEGKIFNFACKHTEKRRVIIAVIFLNNKRTAGSKTISDIKVFYRATEIKIAWCQQKQNIVLRKTQI